MREFKLNIERKAIDVIEDGTIIKKLKIDDFAFNSVNNTINDYLISNNVKKENTKSNFIRKMPEESLLDEIAEIIREERVSHINEDIEIRHKHKEDDNIVAFIFIRNVITKDGRKLFDFDEEILDYYIDENELIVYESLSFDDGVMLTDTTIEKIKNKLTYAFLA